MALKGNCIHIKTKDSETETTTITETNPDGTSEEKTVPVVVEEKTNYTDVYVAVKQVDFFDSYFVNESSALEKRTSCFFHLAAYKNKTTKYNNQEDHLFYESLVLPELNYNTNVYEQIYAFVKTLPGYTEIKNDL